MKECIIHAGPHKTGTTSIQRQLAEMREQLANHRTLLPKTGTTDQNLAAQHNLAFRLNGDSRFNADKGKLNDLVQELKESESDRVLISSEDFLFLAQDPVRLERLHAVFRRRGYRITWVLYLRTFPEWLESVYTQQIKTGTTDRRFHQWLKKGRTHAMSDPATLLGPVFDSADTVKIRSFAQAKKSLFADFLTTCEIPGIEVPKVESAALNQRPSALELELLRLVAGFGLRHGASGTRKRRMQRAKRLAAGLPAAPRYQALSATSAQNLYEATRASYQALLTRAGIDTPFETFFPLSISGQEQTFEGLDLPAESRLALHQTFATTVFGEDARLSSPTRS